MTYDFTRWFLSIDIPRSGCVSRMDTLRRHCPTSATCYESQRHMRARQIRRQLGPERWEAFFRFAVLRPPHEALESDWRLCLREIAKLTPESSQILAPRWYARLMRVKRHGSFGQFVREEWLENASIDRGGLWRTWCEGPNGEGLGVKLFRFDRLQEEWPAICDRIGVPRVELLHHNRTEPATVEWPPGLRAEVEEFFAGDYQLLAT